MGRKKIKIEPIVEEKVRIITFNKRKAGLLKKAAELSMLCNIKLFLSFTDINGNIIRFYGPNQDMVKILLQSKSQNKNIIEFTKEDYPEFFKVKRNHTQNQKKEAQEESQEKEQHSETLEESGEEEQDQLQEEQEEYYKTEENNDDDDDNNNIELQNQQFNLYEQQQAYQSSLKLMQNQNMNREQFQYQENIETNDAQLAEQKENQINQFSNNSINVEGLKLPLKKKKNLTINIPKQNKNLEVEMQFIKLLNTINKSQQKKLIGQKDQNQQQQLLDFAVPTPISGIQDLAMGNNNSQLDEAIPQKSFNQQQSNIQQLQLNKSSNPDSFDNFFMGLQSSNQPFSQLQFPRPFLNSFNNLKSGGGNQIQLNSFHRDSPDGNLNDIIGFYNQQSFSDPNIIAQNQLSSSDSSNQFLQLENFQNSQLQKLLVSPQNYNRSTQIAASQILNENFLGLSAANFPSTYEYNLQHQLNNTNNSNNSENELKSNKTFQDKNFTISNESKKIRKISSQHSASQQAQNLKKFDENKFSKKKSNNNNNNDDDDDANENENDDLKKDQTNKIHKEFLKQDA